MPMNYTEVPTESLGELGRTLLRRELEVAGDRRLGYRERLPLFARAGKAAGLPMVEVARTSGLSRKAAYDAIGRSGTDTSDRTWGLDTALIGLLAGRGALSVQMAESVLRVGATHVRHQLERLVAEGAARRLVGESGGAGVTYYTLDEEAAARLIARRLEDMRGVRADSFSVYFALAPDEVGPVSAATHRIVPDTEWTVIPLGNNSAATTDELALPVRAPNRRVALETSEHLWSEIAKRAGIARGPRITQIIDPRSPD